MLSMVGVYLGRFLRFNSWDVIRDPINLMREAFSMVISNGQVWNIADPDRLAASRLFEAGAMGLVQFVFLYGSFFLLVYMYMYHVKEK